MRKSELWLKCGADFRALAGEEDASVGNRSNDYRLRAYRSKTPNANTWGSTDDVRARVKQLAGDSKIEPPAERDHPANEVLAFQWLIEGPNKNLKARFQLVATQAGIYLEPPAPLVRKPIDYWLDEVRLDIIENKSGYLLGDIITNVCRASENCCAALATAAIETEGPVQDEETPVKRAAPKKRRFAKDDEAEGFRQEAHKMLADRATHLEICQRLAAMPRPARAEWRHLQWDKAYLHREYRASVAKWISRNCR